MNTYIDYSRMCITERQAFNKDRACDEKYIMTQKQWDEELAKMRSDNTKGMHNDQ